MEGKEAEAKRKHENEELLDSIMPVAERSVMLPQLQLLYEELHPQSVHSVVNYLMGLERVFPGTFRLVHRFQYLVKYGDIPDQSFYENDPFFGKGTQPPPPPDWFRDDVCPICKKSYGTNNPTMNEICGPCRTGEKEKEEEG